MSNVKRKLLSTKEAAEYLGFKLSYFRKMMMRRTIPMYKPSGKLCFLTLMIWIILCMGSGYHHKQKLMRKQPAIWLIVENENNNGRKTKSSPVIR